MKLQQLSLLVSSLALLFDFSKAQWGGSNWMSTMSGDFPGYFDFDLFDKSIFEVVFPGAMNVGMYEDAIEQTFSSSQLATNIQLQSLTTDELIGWSVRQLGSTLDTLNAGARFLQMQFELDGTSFKSYSAYFGATATTIIDDINTFLTTNTNELLILYISNNLNINSTSLSELFGLFESNLGDRMANSSTLTPNDLVTTSISTLLGSGINVIAIAEDMGNVTNEYIYDASILTTTYNDTSSITDPDELRTTVVDSLRYGWEFEQLYLLRWRIKVDSGVGSIDFAQYDNFYEYARDTNVDLYDVINTYPKFRFGNVIAVDYFSTTDCLDLSILLNIEYADCNDRNDLWGTGSTDCPSETNLRNTYGSSSTQASCLTNNLTSICARSCGRCPYSTGVPGSECTSDADCDNVIYQYAFDSASATGSCWTTSDDYAGLVSEDSFCKASYAYAACASVDDDDVCTNSVVDYFACDHQCSSNYQCDLGYCSSKYGICMSFNFSSGSGGTTDSNDVITADNRYDFIKSETAEQFRSDIDWLRPGDPDAEYDADFTAIADFEDLMNKNPYLTSVVGFILVPFILSIFLFFCWFWVCIFWCLPCCEPCCKKCCCRMCLGSNPQDTPVAKWTPCVILGCVTIVIIWACIEGIIYNSSMHDHIFAYSENNNGTSSDKSVKSEMNDLFTDIKDRLHGVPNAADGLVDSIFDIVEYTTGALTNTQELDATINTMRNAINTMYNSYAGDITFTASVEDPFYNSVNDTSYEFDCSFCETLADTLVELNDTINEVFVEGVQTLINGLNLTSYLDEAQGEIDEALDGFSTVINDLINQTQDINDEANKQFDFIEPYDESREQGGFAFFTIPFIWVIFPIAGIFLGKWCFKINWCCAMFLGSTVMLILSIFAILTVLWADLCVRLDDFEQNFGESDIGQQLGSFMEDNSTNDSLLGEFYGVINACFTGESLLSVFDLDDLLDLDEYKDSFQEALDMDITSIFEQSNFDAFETELTLFDTSEFTDQTTEAIDTLNAVDDDYIDGFCGCPLYNSTSTVEFTKSLILSFSCSNDGTLNRTNPVNEKDEYWDRMFDYSENSNDTLRQGYATACIASYRYAFGYAFAEENLTSTFETAADAIVTGGNTIIAAVANMTNIVYRIDNVLTNVSCQVEDLFDEIDDIITDYASCGFIGDAYEGFKEVGCELLFSDMYHITRSMSLIAFLSILIVCCSMCMDYVRDPANDDDEFGYDDEQYNKGIASNTAGASDVYSNNNGQRPSYVTGGDVQMQQMGPGAAEGPGAQTNNTHFV